MSFRFLHIADLHLDAPFSGRAELRQRLRSAQRESFSAAVDAALEHQVHALLIAGDLVDQESCAYDTAAFIRGQLTRLHRAGIAVFYAHGNHDPASSALELPSWVETFDSRYARMVEVRDNAGQVVGAVVGSGFARSKEYDSLISSYPRRHGRIPTIGLMHTQLKEEAGRGTPYAPVSLAQLESLQYDYWALGHIHRRQSYGQHIQYSGCLCGAGYGDTGHQGGLLVEVSGQGTPVVRFLPLARMQWEMRTLEGLAACQDEAALFDVVRAAIDGMELTVPAMIRLTLKGEIGCWQLLASSRGASVLEDIGCRMAQACHALAVELTAEDICAPAQVESYQQEVSLLGEMLHTLDAAEQDDGLMDQLLDALEPLGLAGCQHGTRQQQRAYARSLLPGLQQQAIALMRRGDSQS